ncbi:hypothetical protein LX16_0994 [Stackebrandtia albiflava]|uniref:DUF2567 domain-containing protein n=1 Tax=Stackebrandtia albiflava TaxID=406432 RepID=A0A562VBM5_9ACTN|nr:hypothetical protein [Stackebrandtia albiflava]TWJ15294.1 hypothetical protein LX16_0994 [Stackebrandtia albiflava]
MSRSPNPPGIPEPAEGTTTAEAGAAGAHHPAAPPVREPRSRGRDALAALGVLALLAFLGLPLGVIWVTATPRVELVRVPGGWGLTQENPEQYMAADGVFALIGLAAGVIAGVMVWVLLPRRRGPWVLTGLVLGSIACQLVAWWFGRMGRDGYLASMEQAQVGWHYWRWPELKMVDFNPAAAVESLADGRITEGMGHLALGVLATMAFTAAFVYTVCAGWSRFADLRADGPGSDVAYHTETLPGSETPPQVSKPADYPRSGAETH